MRNPLAMAANWRQFVAVCLALPTVAILVVLAFAWPAGRTAPRDVPLGVVGTGSSVRAVVDPLTAAEPGEFDLRLYPDASSARSAIEGRDVYGALDVTSTTITAYEASAASPAVAALITTVATGLAARSHEALDVVDVVPLAASDPRGAVFASSLLPVTIFGVVMAAVVGLLLGFGSVWQKAAAVTVTSALAGLGVWLVAQGFLGAFPHHAVATWAALAMTVLAVSSTVLGLYSVFGAPGLAAGSALLVFVGNAFSGISSAPELLPHVADRIGQWLPPGAGAGLLRSTAYFDGHALGDRLAVLVTWVVFGFGAMALGHHSFAGFAARASADRARLRDEPERAPVPFAGGDDRGGFECARHAVVAGTPT